MACCSWKPPTPPSLAAGTDWRATRPPRVSPATMRGNRDRTGRCRISVRHRLSAGFDDPMKQQEPDDRHEPDHEQRLQDDRRVALGGLRDRAHGEYAERGDHA